MQIAEERFRSDEICMDSHLEMTDCFTISGLGVREAHH